MVPAGGLTGKAGAGALTQGPQHLSRPFAHVLQELQQELLEVSPGQQAESGVQASTAEQLNQVQKVLVSVGPWLGQRAQCQELERREREGRGASLALRAPNCAGKELRKATRPEVEPPGVVGAGTGVEGASFCSIDPGSQQSAHDGAQWEPPNVMLSGSGWDSPYRCSSGCCPRPSPGGCPAVHCGSGWPR